MKVIDQHTVIKRLDAPAMFITIPVADLWLFSLPTIATLVMTSSVLATLSILILMKLLKKMMRRLPKKYGRRFLYWYLPTKVFNRILGTRFAPSHVDQWLRR